MSSDEESDAHFCLRCQTTILGLDKYVHHKTTDCPAKSRRRRKIDPAAKTVPTRSAPADHHVCEKEIAQILSTLEQHTTPVIGRISQETLSSRDTSGIPSPEKSAPSATELFLSNYGLREKPRGDNVVTENGIQPESDIGSQETVMNNFLSSLELKSNKDSASNTQTAQAELQQLLGPPDLADEQNLPITLLTDLQFSSDSEPDLGEYLRDFESCERPRSHGGKHRSQHRQRDSGGKYKPWGRSRPSPGKVRAHRERQRVTSSGGKWKPDSWRSADDRPETRRTRSSRRRAEAQVQAEEPVACDYFAPPDVAAAIYQSTSSTDVITSTVTDVSTVVSSDVITSTSADVITCVPDDVITSNLPCTHSTTTQNDVLAPPLNDVITNSGDVAQKAPNASQGSAPVVEKETKLKAQDEDCLIIDEPLTDHFCTVCVRSFQNRHIMARHLLTRMHHNRAVHKRQEALDMLEEYHDLVMRLSPFQCHICQFYCHTNKDLMSHLASEEHRKLADDILGPQFCVLCRYTTEEGNGMIEHFRTGEHETMVLSQSEHRPCVVREKRTAINCTKCDAVVASSKRLKSHNLTAHGSGKRGPKVRVNRTCEYCGKKFCTQKAMATHVQRIHTKEQPYHCDHCNKGFADKYSLADHEKTKSHLRILAFIETPEQQTIEPQVPKRKMGSNKCEHCEFDGKDYEELKLHCLSVHEDKNLKCEPCGLQFVNSAALANHKKSKKHLNRVPLPQKTPVMANCNKCNTFVDENEFQIHQQSHETEIADFNHEQLSSPCTVRNKSSQSAGEETSHIMEDQEANLAKKCPYCDKSLKSRSAYNDHIAKHTIPEEKHVRCRFCSKTFSHDWKLNQHYRTKHDDKTLICCYPGCRKSFSRQCDFTAHNRTHTNERSYFCDLCNYKAPTKLGLQRHRVVHSDFRGFSCEYCTYKAKLYSHLRRHMRIHIGCKPFKCPHCEYACNTIENLRKHIKNTRKHAGKSIYQCPIENCPFETDSAKDFRSHLQSHPGHEEEYIASIISGIYAKEEDSSVPEEGAQVLPSKDRMNIVKVTDLHVWNDTEAMNGSVGGEEDDDFATTEEVETVTNTGTVITADSLTGQEMIEVEIINPDGEEIELTPENINLLVQQALMNHQSEMQQIQFIEIPSEEGVLTMTE